jgi:hypothetical protein
MSSVNAALLEMESPEDVAAKIVELGAGTITQQVWNASSPEYQAWFLQNGYRQNADGSYSIRVPTSSGYPSMGSRYSRPGWGGGGGGGGYGGGGGGARQDTMLQWKIRIE